MDLQPRSDHHYSITEHQSVPGGPVSIRERSTNHDYRSAILDDTAPFGVAVFLKYLNDSDRDNNFDDWGDRNSPTYTT